MKAEAGDHMINLSVQQVLSLWAHGTSLRHLTGKGRGRRALGGFSGTGWGGGREVVEGDWWAAFGKGEGLLLNCRQCGAAQMFRISP